MVTAVVVVVMVVVVMVMGTGSKAEAEARVAEGGCDMDDPRFDDLILAVQWPPGTSYARRREFGTWTLHGLWPSRSGPGDADTYPCHCSSEALNLDAVRAFEREMRSKWPSLASDDDEAFWAHEWTKHGTCFVQAYSGLNQTAYFSSALELLRRADPGRALARARLAPRPGTDRAVPLWLLRWALKPAMLGCRTSSDGRQLLAEVGLCFDKSAPFSPGVGPVPCSSATRLVRDEINDCDADKLVFVVGAAPPKLPTLPDEKTTSRVGAVVDLAAY